MAWLKNVGNGVGDFVESFADDISGKANQDALKKQLEQQRQTNEQVFNLEKERLALRTSPEYIAQQQKKTFIAAGVVVLCLVFAFLIMRK